jgi:hypothetical protein
MMSTKRAQGFVTVPVAVIATIVALAVPIYMIVSSDAQVKEAASRGNAELSIDVARVALSSWYERTIANDTAQVLVAPTFQQLGVDAKPTWRILVSEPITEDSLRFRRFVIVEEARPESSTAFTPSTGAFTSSVGNVYRQLDGKLIHTAALLATEERLKRLATLLQRRYSVMLTTDPLRDTTINHFRPRQGCSASANEIPCVDDYQAASTVGLQTILGLEPAGLVSGWGSPVEVSNGVDSNTVAPPYTMALRARTPWGTYVTAAAVQPLN